MTPSFTAEGSGCTDVGVDGVRGTPPRLSDEPSVRSDAAASTETFNSARSEESLGGDSHSAAAIVRGKAAHDQESLKPTHEHSTQPHSSTPLHQRFLAEVNMANGKTYTPTTHSPHQPHISHTPSQVHTPRHMQSPTPTLRSQMRSSPTRSSPARSPTRRAHREAPAKEVLEIGQNGFYFSCELPMSKVSPRKNGIASRTGTPSKTSRAGTPSKTGSPSKTGTPSKAATPSRTGTPSRCATATPTGRRKKGHGGEGSRGTSERGQRTPGHSMLGKQMPGRATSPLKNVDVEHTQTRLRGTRVLENTATTKQSKTPVNRTLFGTPSRGRTVGLDLGTTTVVSATTTPMGDPGFENENDTLDKEGEVHVLALAIPTSASPSALHNSVSASTTGVTKPQNIGHLMANLRNSMGSAAEVETGVEVSPAPTPLRRAAERMGIEIAPRTVKSVELRDGEGGEREEGESTTPPCEPEGDKLDGIVILHRSTLEVQGSPVPASLVKSLHVREEVVSTTPPSEPEEEKMEDLAFPYTGSTNAADLQVSRLPAPLVKSAKADISQGSLCRRTARHVTWPDMASPRPTASSHSTRPTARRVGTDPNVLLAMKREMANVEIALRRSTGQGFVLSAAKNRTSIPVMSTNTKANEDEDVKMQPLRKYPSATGSTSVGTPSNPGTRANSTLGTSKRAVKPHTSGTPRSHLTSISSAQARREKGAAARQANAQRETDKRAKTPATSRAQPKILDLGTPSRVRNGGATTLGRPSTGMRTPIGARGPTPRSRLPATPARPTVTSIVPKSGLKSDTPSTTTSAKPALPSSRKTLDLKPPPRSKPIGTVQRNLKTATLNTKDIPANADKPPSTSTPPPTPANGTIHIHQDTPEESFTPAGSPAKPLSPTPSPINTHQPCLAPPPTVRKPPITPPATTPQRLLRHPRPRAQAPRPAALRTPGNSRIAVFDRNALRTPSKSIVESLDRAINEKIREDRRGWGGGC